MINAKIALQLDEKVVTGRVIQRALGTYGKIVGSCNDNPMLNFMIYEVEFPDFLVKYYVANAISKNMLSQVDDDGYSVTLIDSIVYYKIYASAVDKYDKYVTTRREQSWLRKTTQGWKFLLHGRMDPRHGLLSNI